MLNVRKLSCELICRNQLLPKLENMNESLLSLTVDFSWV